MSEPIAKKKRGRKPKNFNTLLQKNEGIIISEEKIITEEEKVIFHIPITMDEINSHEAVDMSLFIKSENDIKNDTKLNSSNVVTNFSKMSLIKIQNVGGVKIFLIHHQFNYQKTIIMKHFFVLAIFAVLIVQKVIILI
jgi:hypothetical protein